ncbi:MAG: hypothetical protein M1540_04120 [Candidatus Bathyarchaeota archaeon]|nr:hypothetical protein [Candidatus Bathyarchaeota archaeon]
MNLNDNTDYLCGADSKKYRIYATSSSANPVVKVQSNWLYPDPYSKSPVIENLVIDGQNQGVTGILLQNVVGAQIRNVTIKNCAVGIHLRSYYGLWSETNCIKHIRMENVTKGIVFTTTGPNPDTPETYPGDSAGFTTIDDVGISLANTNDAVGIQIGGIQISNDPYRNDVTSTTIKPYSSRIKANIWMGSQGGTGLRVLNGEVKFVQAHLTVSGPSSGIGVDVSTNKAIWFNQFSTFSGSPPNDSVTEKGFMLATTGIGTPITPSNAETDILTKSF